MNTQTIAYISYTYNDIASKESKSENNKPLIRHCKLHQHLTLIITSGDAGV